MAANRSAPSAREVKYRLIAMELQEDISRGVRKPGEKIPSIHELAEAYGVTPATVQAAIQILKEQRFVEGRQGAGTFVLPREVWAAEYRVQLGHDGAADPATRPRREVEAQHSLTDELATLDSYRELAERDRDFSDRFMRQLRRMNSMLAMEHGYWEAEQSVDD